MKKVFLYVGCIAAFAACAMTNETSKAEQLRMKTGGFVYDKRQATGRLVIVNAQKRVSEQPVLAEVSQLERDCMMLTCLVSRDSFDLSRATEVMSKENASVAVFLVDIEGLPSVMVSPEQRFSVVNVRALSSEGLGDEALANRVKKELARAAAFAFGAGYSVMGGGLMMPVSSVDALDELPMGALTLETTSVIQRLATSHFGFKLFRRTFYVNALKEGWAPPPKGEYQKVLWEAYHAKPTEPMKIEYDPAKGR